MIIKYGQFHWMIHSILTLYTYTFGENDNKNETKVTVKHQVTRRISLSTIGFKSSHQTICSNLRLRDHERN